VVALQLFATIIAGVAGVQFVHRVLLRRDLGFLVAFGQMVAVPGAALVAYVFEPVYVPFSTWFAVAGASLVFVATGIRIVTGGRAERRPADHVWSSTDLGRGSQLATRAFAVTGITVLVFGLEPAFALANVVVNLLWVFACMPPWLRVTTAENSIEVSARPSAVWDVMTDPSRGIWTAGKVIEQQFAPAGRVRIGTRITTVRMAPLMTRWRGRDEIRLRSESEVVGLVEDSSITVVASDRRSGTERSVVASDHGSVVRMRTWFRSTVSDAIIGRSLVLRQRMRDYDTIATKMLIDFKTAVEAAG